MSDTNRVAFRVGRESTFGAIPASPTLYDVPFASAPSLAFSPETTVSELIRSDRQIDDLPLVGGEASGDLNSELAYRVHELLLEGSFFSTFQERYQRVNDEAETQITAVDGTGEEFTVLDEGSSLAQGDLVRAEGFSLSANNGIHLVDAGVSNTAIVVTSDLEDETPPNGARIHFVGREAATGDIAAEASPDRLTSTTLDFTALDLQAGDWIKLSGSGGTWPAGNNVWVRVSTVAANQLDLDIVPSGWTADGGASATVRIFVGRRLVNGTTRHSHFLEETFEDHSPVTYQYFRGQLVDGLTINAEPQSIVTLGFTFSGKDAFFSDQNTPASTPDELPAVAADGRVASPTVITNPKVNVLNSSSNVGRIARGGTPIEGSNFVLEASFEIANNLRQTNAVGFLGAVQIGVGEFSVTGSLNTLFDDATLARDVIANAETSFDIRFADNDNHFVIVDAPRIKFSEGAPEVAGKNQDVPINLSYQAIRDPSKGYTLGLFAFDGVE